MITRSSQLSSMSTTATSSATDVPVMSQILPQSEPPKNNVNQMKKVMNSGDGKGSKAAKTDGQPRERKQSDNPNVPCPSCGKNGRHSNDACPFKVRYKSKRDGGAEEV